MWWVGDDRELQKEVVLVRKEQLDLLKNEVSAFPFLLFHKSWFSRGDMIGMISEHGMQNRKSYSSWNWDYLLASEFGWYHNAHPENPVGAVLGTSLFYVPTKSGKAWKDESISNWRQAQQAWSAYAPPARHKLLGMMIQYPPDPSFHLPEIEEMNFKVILTDIWDSSMTTCRHSTWTSGVHFTEIYRNNRGSWQSEATSVWSDHFPKTCFRSYRIPQPSSGAYPWRQRLVEGMGMWSFGGSTVKRSGFCEAPGKSWKLKTYTPIVPGKLVQRWFCRCCRMYSCCTQDRNVQPLNHYESSAIFSLTNFGSKLVLETGWNNIEDQYDTQLYYIPPLREHTWRTYNVKWMMCL